MRIVHFSDVHVREGFPLSQSFRYGWRRAACEANMRLSGRARDFGDAGGTFRNLMAKIEELKPDHVIFSGDFTASATPLEFRQAKEILGGLAQDRARFSAVPGNHDRYTAGSVATRRYEAHFGHLLESDLPGFATSKGYPFVRLVGEALAVVGVDTTRLAPIPGLSFGEIPLEELAALGRILEQPEIQRRHVMLLMHHVPFGPSGRPDTPTHGLWHRELFLDVVRRHPRLTLHCGHVHRRYVLPATASCPRIFNPGSGTLHRGPGFFVLDLDGDGEIASFQEVAVPIA